MKKVITSKKTINGVEYDYTLCPRCQVYILTENYKKGHEGCDRHYKNLEIRRRATAMVMIGRIIGNLMWTSFWK